MEGQERKSRDAFKLSRRSDTTLEQRVDAQRDVRRHDETLRRMRLKVFDVEDAAVAAINTGDLGGFKALSELFPKTNEAIAIEIARRTRPNVEQRSIDATDVAASLAPRAPSPQDLAARVAIAQSARDAAEEALQSADLGFTQRVELSRVLSARQNDLDAVQAEVDLLRHTDKQTEPQTQPAQSPAETEELAQGPDLEELLGTPPAPLTVVKSNVDISPTPVTEASASLMAEFLRSSNYSPMLLARARIALEKQVRLDGVVMPSHSFIHTLIARGLEPSVRQEDRIKPMSRMANFRATNEEQRAHERKIKEGGTVAVYSVGNYDVGAFEYALASYLVQREAALTVPPATALAPEDVETPDADALTAPLPSEFYLDGSAQGPNRGATQRYRDNIHAIRILRLLASESRDAVHDERLALARYVGWGGLKGVFDPNNKQWAKEHLELRALLNDSEWAAASRSQLDAFYTPSVPVKAIYAAVQRMGFEHGRTLEPSIGIGNFFGLMPQSMRERSSLHGVELDLLTSQIVAALYPKAVIAKATGFENYKMPGGYFDMVVGNPPFGSHMVSDEKGSAYSGWQIHSYFFAKSIELLRPGGIMPMVVTHNFLDKLDPHVRRWISRRAELVSGVRLPETAFKASANTEVVTDILIFKRLDDEQSLGKSETPDWLDTSEVTVEDPATGDTHTVTINNYFINNPQNVLGTNAATGSMYRGNEYSVIANGDIEEQLAQWVSRLPQGIYVPAERTVEELQTSAVVVPDGVKEGSFFVQGGDVMQRLTDLNGQQRAVKWTEPNQRAGERMRGMIDLREKLREQMRLERTLTLDSVERIEEGRRTLNRTYDAFQRKFGYINDPTNRRIFIDDTESALVEALEFDYRKSVTAARALEHGLQEAPSWARKADIFNHRVLFPPGEEHVVHSAKDALLHSLNVTGRIDMAFMQRVYPKSEEDLVEELGNLIYMDPVGGYETADAYLSGDVKTKLREVTLAAERDPSFQRNVDALKGVIPKDKLPSEIHASLGAPWIPEKVYSDFVTEVTGGTASFTYVGATAQWLHPSYVTGADRTKNSDEFGTEKMSALNIMSHIMNSRAPEVKKLVLVDGVEKYVTDEAQTELVRQKVNKINSHWESWLWTDGQRADQLAAIYNDRFNRTVERQYDGSHLTFPGMNPALQLLPHQKNGAWRGLQTRKALLDKVVGAGKTFEVVALVMEMRRLGISKKPLLGVPNHLTLQWRQEFYRLYPGANVLAATPSDFEKDNRERFFSKVVTGNWDAVIVGHSSLKKIPVPPQIESKIIGEQFDEISKAIEVLKRERGDRNIVRDMEKIKANLQVKLNKLKEKAGARDKVVDFADLGVDGIVIDESHYFKALFYTTQMNRVAGMGNAAGSGMAFDLFVKMRFLEETFGSGVPAVMASGTPISNSLVEMHAVQRFMQYDHLKSMGLHLFDAWAKTFAEVQNVYEVSPSGTGYRLSQRFSQFKNLGTLMGQYRSFADVLTLDDLKAQELSRGKVFPVPRIQGDRPTNIVAPRSKLQESFFGIPEVERSPNGEIVFEFDTRHPTVIVPTEDKRWAIQQQITLEDGEQETRLAPKRYDSLQDAQEALVTGAVTPRMKVDPRSIVGQFENIRELTRMTKGKINALSLTGLANKAGLDYRLIDPGAPDFPDSKINQAVRRIIAIGKQWEADKGTQLIFCDLSVPLSAKARMANKEKRVYVRDDAGFLVHKKGTLHCPKGYEGFPYYLVQMRAGKERSYTIYDASSGVPMKDGLDTKQDAHAFVMAFLTKENGQERWLDEREKRPAITPEEIDEHKNEYALDADGDATDLEISLDDVEGSTGVAAFSVYDDIKTKLIAAGVPPAEIEFIHDHDSPQAKHELFRRVNAGDVRYLLGSTFKMGAGTNVQERAVALHHIDAPWRPSDLEQREGRVVRRGNKLYERDPEGFSVFIGRYATSQTYDTRRWQILQHKANGLLQLRNYAGANEMQDVASEAANSADMKAAASGNPLILRETQLATEVKTLKLLERAHRDAQYSGRRKLEWELNYVEKAGPKELSKVEKHIAMRDGATSLASYRGKSVSDREQLMAIIENINAATDGRAASFELTYRGLTFTLERETVNAEHKCLVLPDNTPCYLEAFSKVGIITRMENWVNGLERSKQTVEVRMADAEKLCTVLRKRLAEPFAQADALKDAVLEHGKVQRALIKSNALAAVKPEDAKEFEAAVNAQKQRLVKWGFSEAITQLEARDAELNALIAPDGKQPPVSMSIPLAFDRPDGTQSPVAIPPKLLAASLSNHQTAPTAATVRKEGQYSGTVLSVSDGMVTQRVHRDGRTTRHQLADLDKPVAPGQLVDIRYRGGRAVVTHQRQERGVGQG